MALNTKAASSGVMSYTNQGLLHMAIGCCLAPFTGGLSMVYGACHLGCGVLYDQYKHGKEVRRD